MSKWSYIELVRAITCCVIDAHIVGEGTSFFVFFPTFHDARHIKLTGKYLQCNDTKNGKNYHVV